jgi:uncharacterized protein
VILKRAKSERFLTRLRLMLWPRRSFSRSFRYFGKRLVRLRASPHSIAIGLAAGIFAACSPLLGLHIVIALALAWTLSGNLVAAALGTAFCNPLTFPFIIAGDVKMGALILHTSAVTNTAPEMIGNLWSGERLAQLWQPVLKPMLVGSIPIGLTCAAAAYIVGGYLIKVFKEHREATKGLSR